jgi:hypothetical protein
VTFFRTLGGAIGSAVLGAVLIAEERTATAGSIARHGTKLGPLYAFTHGMDRAYLWSVPVAIVAFALSWRLKEVKLSDADPPPDETEQAVEVPPEAAMTGSPSPT